MAVALTFGVGGAVANHVPQVDPATVPAGFLATHNDVDSFRVKNFKRAAKRGDADVFVQHAFIAANGATIWHTHPGPVIVTVVQGVLNYQREEGHGRHRRCETTAYTPGNGFVDPGFGHVHRAVAGPDGVHFYATYVLPTGSTTHIIPADPPESCQ
jgi:quercetin dioxygenase-like cupin family protein